MNVDPFEDVKRELVNGRRFASNYDEFVEKMLFAIMKALNTTDEGQEIMDDALGKALRSGMSPEDWQKQKANILIVLFFLSMEDCSMLRHEFCHHLYKELRKEVT